MFEKWKNILTVGLLSAFVLGFGIWAAVKPADALSTSERRPLAAFFFAPLAPKRPGNSPQLSEILTEKGLAKPSRCAMMRPKRSARRAHFRKRG